MWKCDFMVHKPASFYHKLLRSWDMFVWNVWL